MHAYMHAIHSTLIACRACVLDFRAQEGPVRRLAGLGSLVTGGTDCILGRPSNRDATTRATRDCTTRSLGAEHGQLISGGPEHGLRDSLWAGGTREGGQIRPLMLKDATPPTTQQRANSHARGTNVADGANSIHSTFPPVAARQTTLQASRLTQNETREVGADLAA